MRKAHAEEAKTMNHRYQHFDWEPREGRYVKPRMSYTGLCVWAIGGAIVGYVLAVVLACL